MKKTGGGRDRLFYYSLASMASIALATVLVLGFILLWYAYPAIAKYGAGLLSPLWRPSEASPEKSVYGLLAPLLGTLATATIAIAIALPLSVSATLLVEEYAPSFLKGALAVMVDAMAAIPTIVYGFWGLRVLAPLLRDYVYRPLHEAFGWIPLFSCEPLTGANTLTAGLVLAIMITPYMFAIIREAYRSIPYTYREAILALGATRYEASRILLSMIKPALIASLLLGFGRAAGETVAVALVVGSVPSIPLCLLAPSYTISSLIANTFGEASLYPYMVNALYAGGLILLAIGLASNILGLKYLARVRPSELG